MEPSISLKFASCDRYFPTSKAEKNASAHWSDWQNCERLVLLFTALDTRINVDRIVVRVLKFSGLVSSSTLHMEYVVMAHERYHEVAFLVGDGGSSCLTAV